VSVDRQGDLSPASPPVRQASVSVGRVKRPVFAALRYQLVARATYLAKPRYQLVARATYLAKPRFAHSAVREKTELRMAGGGGKVFVCSIGPIAMK